MPLLTEDTQIRDLLGRLRRVAVIGLSSKPERASYNVARAMQAEGFQIVPVNPNETQVLGENAFPDLAHVTGMVDMVDVFRAPEHVPQIVDACITCNVRNLWLQKGVIHQRAAEKAADAGIDVVMDRCMLKEYQRLLG